jgi:putative peptidoglycan lipid II flippase
MTMISRVLGFVRDIVFARIFGADATTDAFFLAFKIPNFLRRLFAEGAFSQAFIPVFTEYKENRDKAELKELLDRVAGTFGVVLFFITLIGVVAAPWLIMAFGPGFLEDEHKYGLAVDMLRITFPYIFFISLTAFAGSILNSHSKFAVPAITPVFLNLCLISAAIWGAPMMEVPIMALAWGVFIAGMVQLAFQLPFLFKMGLLPRPRWGAAHEGVRRIGKLMMPAIFGSSVVQINLLLDTVIASFLITGSISWLYYSDRLVEFPLGVFGIALATVILPKLSKDVATASMDTFAKTLDWAMRWVLVIGTPAAMGLIMLAAPMLATLFFGGEFGVDDVEMSAMSLMAYSLGLLGFIMVKVLAPGFYARQDTKTPVKIGIIAMVCNMGLNIAIVVPWVMLDYIGPHTGLALATAGSGFINAGMLFYKLRKEGVYQAQPGWPLFALRVVFASVMMGGVLFWFVEPLSVWTLEWTTLERIMHLLKWLAVGVTVYFGSLLLSGFNIKGFLRTSF